MPSDKGTGAGLLILAVAAVTAVAVAFGVSRVMANPPSPPKGFSISIASTLPRGSTASFTVSGARPDSVIDVGLLGNNQGMLWSARAQTNSSGVAAGSFLVPSNYPAGVYDFTAVEETGNGGATVVVNLT